MTVKNWKIAGAGDSTTIAHLRSILKVDPIIARLLAQRNITSYEEAEDFFNPSLEKLHDPFLMKGMEEAFILLKAAISNQRRILLYGDYDVDGTSAVALLYTVLKNYSPSIVYYIPDRYNEGYGLSDNGVDYAIDEGIDLLITLDCGIRSVDKIARLRAAGIDVIVCDHHLPGDQ